jgi:hypothetical protein
MRGVRRVIRSAAPFLHGIHGACGADGEDRQQGFLLFAGEPCPQLFGLLGHALGHALDGRGQLLRRHAVVNAFGRYQCSEPVNWLMMAGSRDFLSVMAGLLIGFWVAAAAATLGRRRDRGSKDQADCSAPWNKWGDPEDDRRAACGALLVGGNRLCRERPKNLLDPREGSALRSALRQRAIGFRRQAGNRRGAGCNKKTGAAPSFE